MPVTHHKGLSPKKVLSFSKWENINHCSLFPHTKISGEFKFLGQERDMNCEGKQLRQMKILFPLLYIEAHPLRKPTLHHPVTLRQSDSWSSGVSVGGPGNPGIPEFQIPYQEISPALFLFFFFQLFFLLTLPSVPYRSEVFLKTSSPTVL